MSKICSCLFLITIFLCPSSLYPQSFSSWNTLKTGAGGWITGFDIHPSGEVMYAKSDVGGAYRYNKETKVWTQLVTASSMPAEDVHWKRYQGVQSIISDPSNVNRVFMAYDQGIYVSDNQGDNWIKMNAPAIEYRANDDESKLSGERLAVDPANNCVIYYGSIDDGLYVTKDRNNWTSVPQVPNGAIYRGIRTVLFDPSGGLQGNLTRRLYALVDGSGVWQSNDAGSTWTNISDMSFFSSDNPLFYDAEIDDQGTLYICGTAKNDQGDQDPSNDHYESYGVLRYKDGSWTRIFDDPIAMSEIAIDPNNSDRVIIFSEGYSDTYRSDNATTQSPTWTAMSEVITAPNIPWIAGDANDWFTLGEVRYDPVVPGKIWISHGTGVYHASDLDGTTYTWIEESYGQEHLVSNDVVAFSNGNVLTAHWDFSMFLHDDLDKYPTEIKPTDRFNDTWDIAQSASDENFLVAITEDKRYCCFDDGQARNSSYSEDGGVTWTRFATMPETPAVMTFGMAAISTGDNDNIVWLPAQDGRPFFTRDRGQTWTEADLPGASEDCCLGAIFFKRKILAADPIAQGTFYLYDWGGGHIFTSIDGGGTWKKNSEVLGTYAFHGKLLPVPGREEHLLFANGPEDAIDFIEPLAISEDGGQSWTYINNTNHVLNVAVGKAKDENSYPTIFITGEVDGTYGYHMSTDKGANWTFIGDYPLGIYDWPMVMEGDKDRYGTLYVGFAGNGFVYHTLTEDLSAIDVLLTRSDIQILHHTQEDSYSIQGELSSYRIDILNQQGDIIETLSSSSPLLKIQDLDMSQHPHFMRIRHLTNRSLDIQIPIN